MSGCQPGYGCALPPRTTLSATLFIWKGEDMNAGGMAERRGNRSAAFFARDNRKEVAPNVDGPKHEGQDSASTGTSSCSCCLGKRRKTAELWQTVQNKD